MNKVMTSGNDGFWAKVRAALGRGSDAQSDPAFATRKSRPAQRIDDELRRGWNEAAQRNVSLCVLALEMDGHGDYFAAYGPETVERCLDRLEEAIQGQLGAYADRCLRSGKAGFVLILPDLPILMARELASRLAAAVRHAGLPHRESHAGHVTMSMGLSVVNPRGGFDRDVLNCAVEGVARAQRRGLARLEVTDLRATPEKRRKAA